ncbi:malate:quinone oxidoreductase [Chitinophaga sedimenti]|uniref:malate:quinone oxidoreductase n=1 Tax=Chitinophaga sedimenti TaxID=2033606 RepID=UPI0020056679|nr:malate:quinone oxidoreductase [Chitinophaga sedimenti]MCK7553682.1 malate:quinone oxidoreductase [Chitinophaga sedimenti]
MSIDKNAGRDEADIVLIGAGIMSATLGMMLKELEPGLTVQVFERLDVAAAESSDAWNNAGTGHSAFCELNYTPQAKDGSVEIKKAVKIAESFEQSKQFWAYLIESNHISLPESFIRRTPHMSFVWGADGVSFLRKRYEALSKCHLFSDMKYSEDKKQLADWMPIVMEGRNPDQDVAATRMEIGTDVNFGSLTRHIFERMKQDDKVSLHFNHDVKTLRQKDGHWYIEVKDLATGKRRLVKTKFVFIGAGGGSLPLLLKSKIPESKGFGGFPVSGQWLKCKNPELIEKHYAKVYGKAPIGSPPMSVPHLDTRIIKGKKELLFGPYAGFTTKFLKKGSFLDLILSIRLSNIRPMLSAGAHNLPLTKYLIDQVRQSAEDRLDALKDFLPGAKMEDWELEVAGYRVQVIKKDEDEGGILEFGTEVVSAADGSIAALLGASPGASTSVSIMLDLMNKCFPEQMQSAQWKAKFAEMIPSYGKSLASDAALCDSLREWTGRVLKIEEGQKVNA